MDVLDPKYSWRCKKGSSEVDFEPAPQLAALHSIPNVLEDAVCGLWSLGEVRHF